MQIAEQEIIFPLKTSLRVRLVVMSGSFLVVLGTYVRALIQSAGQGIDLFSWFVLILGAVLLVLNGGLLVWSFCQQRVLTPMLRITTEGIIAPIFIPWRDITAIFPYTPLGGGLVVGIVVRDVDALLARDMQDQAPGAFLRWFLRVNAWLFARFPGYLAQVNIPQRMFPLSIHEVLAQIRIRFATELDQHQITIREWQT